MKKIILGVFALSLITFVACKKDIASPDAQATEQFTSNLNDDDYTYIDDSNSFDDEKEPVELDTRATDPFSITSIEASTKVASSDMDGCTTHKFIDLGKANASFTISGVGFGTAKGSSTLVAYSSKDTSTKFTVGITSWSATSIVAAVSGVSDTAKNFTMKFTLTNPAVPKDSTASSPSKFVSKTKTKSVKVLGTNSAGNFFGSSTYELKKLKGSIPSSYTTIDSTGTGNYTPAVGDVVQNSTGVRGYVSEIGSNDAKGRKPITIVQRNTGCKSALKIGKWNFLKAFIAKTDGSTWTKFAH